MEFETKSIKVDGLTRNILLQNENGPCALVALTNVLVLSPQHKADAQELIQLINSNRKVTLEDLITTLANIGVTMDDGQSEDVNELLQLLPQLHTGLNVNPAFNGTFQDDQALSLFRLFQVSLVHGWIVDPTRNEQQYHSVSHYSYDDAQNLLVHAFDIQNNGLQVENPVQVLEDAQYLKSFLARSATQLTEYGIQHLHQLLQENSYSVFFRNDHFSTVHKSNGKLYTLVTDLGYKSASNIVWQSLRSVKGNQDSFFTSEFLPTSLDQAAASGLDSAAATHQPNDESSLTDEQLARLLQEEEDSRGVNDLRSRQERRAAATNSASHSKSSKKGKDKKSW
ncbi:unnamed protein product [Kluyveromyces dobzhanskii CBS 2104]|uniref:WGS project CCBQ000000000 data, contig 00107 n=1 Tax=Kluyveromyces dobzhanskii CBS 2104 TaxID=1427455 RepID=A0A0A8KYV6_9SACH|nr:unnamed protein product [Kluyveromyces dobzhanskii CBS 2104]